MKLGAKRHRVTVQRSTIANDTYGEGIETWVELYVTWAEILSLSGEERVRGHQVEGSMTHRMFIRKHPDYDVTNKDRVVYGSRTYDIVSVDDVELRGEQYDMMVREVTT